MLCRARGASVRVKIAVAVGTVLTAAIAHGQQPATATENAATEKPWIGEWGQFERSGPANAPVYNGAQLDVSACTAGTCKVHIQVQHAKGSGYCDATSDLTLQSPTTAVARLRSVGGEDKCDVALTRGEAADAPIDSRQSGADCAYFCIAPGTFVSSFRFRSHTLFYGSDTPRCFVGDSRARSAICVDASLAALEEQWTKLADEVADLLPHDGAPTVTDTAAALLQRCDKASDPGACLRTAYTGDIAELKQKKQEWLASVTAPGDPAKADAWITQLAGNYRSREQNGDITGRSYMTTDKMSIVRASKTAIKYSLDLNFFNGHTCSREGVAEYRKSGSFISHTKDSPDGDCYFEITPTATGFTLGDPTGMCREYDCGARGGYGSEGFTFAQRVKAKR